MQIENFKFIVGELVQMNPDNSRPMSTSTFLLFQLNTLCKETLTNRQTLSKVKPLCNDRSVLNLPHGYYTTIKTSKRLFCHNLVSRCTNQPISNWIPT